MASGRQAADVGGALAGRAASGEAERQRHGSVAVVACGTEGLPGSAEIAAQRLRQRFPDLRVAGTYCPPYGFERDAAENAKAIEAIRAANADILFVALGTPKQEIWLSKHQREIGVPVSMGVGAALDFLSGKVKRAPRWVQQCGLEWLWRLMQEPRRLWRRYLVDDMIIVPLLLRELKRPRHRDDAAEDSSHA